MSPETMQNGVTVSITDKIRDYLRKHGFYYYRLYSQQITREFEKEYKKSLDPFNKRNLHVEKLWHEFDTLGKPRRIVSLDLGGTNLNLFDIRVQENNEYQITSSHSVNFYEDKIYTPEVLYHDLKHHLDLFLLDSDDRESLEHLVFVFAFPQEQFFRDDGTLDSNCTYFGKLHKSEGIIGMQVGLGFENYLRRHGYKNVRIITTNDAPIYLMAAKGFEIHQGLQFDAAIDIIVGTGVNISVGYDEIQDEKNRGLRIVTTEFGDYSGVKQSKFDEIYDRSLDSTGRYTTEKMISGAWQQHIFQVILKDLLENGVIEDQILQGLNFDELDAVRIEEKLRTKDLADDQKKVLVFLWKEINKRGAAICGKMLANIMADLYKRSGKEKLRVIVVETGSVIHKSMGFREALLDSVDNELGLLDVGEKVDCAFYNFHNQSAIGAMVFDTIFG